MVDLSAKPFNLDQDAISWVHTTVDAMTLEEKIGQLFINHNNEFTPEYLDDILGKYHESGGNMSRTAEALGVERSNLYRKMKAYGLLPARRDEA